MMKVNFGKEKMMNDSPKVFISYAHEDRESAKRLYNDIKITGITPWIDTEELIPGQKWKIAVKQAIRESRYFIAILSTKSISKRGYVQKELKMALELLDEFPESDIFIIPVRIENCEPSMEKLREIHWVDLFPSWNDGLKNIVKVIGNIKANEPKIKIDNRVICVDDEENIRFFPYDKLTYYKLIQTYRYIAIGDTQTEAGQKVQKLRMGAF